MGKYYIFIGIGVELIGIVLTMAFFGSWLDRKYELNGIGLISLIFLGLISWFYHLVILLKRLTDREEDIK